MTSPGRNRLDQIEAATDLEIIAYSSSVEWRKNQLVSAAQYRSALSKNIVDFDTPLVRLADAKARATAAEATVTALQEKLKGMEGCTMRQDMKLAHKINFEAWSRTLIGFIRHKGLEQELKDWSGGWTCPIGSDPEAPFVYAAAPEMLAALKHAALNMPHPDQMIDDAIAKAQGRS